MDLSVIITSKAREDGAVRIRRTMNENLSGGRVRFWGVRGSFPSPGPATARYGGNTPCVSIEGAELVDGVEHIAVLDAGTGMRALGFELAARPAEILLLLTHTHWDHIQGFPHFAPLYQPGRKIHLSRYERKRGLFRYLLEQMDGTRFPLTQREIRSELDSYSETWVRTQALRGYRVRRIRVNHPGETYGFRLQLRNATVVYIPDNELEPPYEPLAPFAELVAFCKGAHLLIHDAQYLESDMPRKRGWGHSLVSQVWKLAQAAQVEHLVLFHHDPDRTDDELDAIQVESRRWFAERCPQTRCTVAYEGLEVPLPL
jgi:phosphoribosyl 1,2-cyclic phosphodiesterase